MNCIYRAALVLFVFLSFSGAYVGKAICGEVNNGASMYNSHELNIYAVQTKAEKGEVETGVLKDPVCGMEISNPEEAPSYVHEGMVYYFCSEECMKKFKKDPSAYTRK